MKNLVWQAVVVIAAGCARPSGTEIEMEAREFRYWPDRIEVEAGVPVHLTMKNRGEVLHDLYIGLGNAPDEKPTAHAQGAMGHHNHDAAPGVVHLMAVPNERAHIRFEAEKPGRYEIYCTVPGHREAGMRAELIVREKNPGTL